MYNKGIIQNKRASYTTQSQFSQVQYGMTTIEKYCDAIVAVGNMLYYCLYLEVQWNRHYFAIINQLGDHAFFTPLPEHKRKYFLVLLSGAVPLTWRGQLFFACKMVHCRYYF